MLFRRKADESFSVRREDAGTGDEADIAAVLIYNREVPCLRVVKLLGRFLQGVGGQEQSLWLLHERRHSVFVVQLRTEHHVTD